MAFNMHNDEDITQLYKYFLDSNDGCEYQIVSRLLTHNSSSLIALD